MKVKVWNDNVHPYTEKFEDRMISIPPQSFIYMEEDEAVTFKGKYSPIKVDFDNRHLPEGYKMIRVERPSQAELDKTKPKHDMYYCHACGKIEASKASLETHVMENHKHLMVEEEPAPAKKTKKEMAS